MSYCLNPDCEQPENQKNAQVCLNCGTKLLLKQRYRAIKPIGQGGFGRTFLAVDEDKPSKPACVIKQFLPQAQGTNNIQKAAELFGQEVLRLNNLGKHNQIPNLLEYLTQEKHQYLVQDYIDGHNLVQILTEQGCFNEAKIYELLNSLLPVLEFIHQNEVIHRDVKPENIIRSRSGQLFLVDFGAAKVIKKTAMLQTGTSIGTPEFVAPEQSRGKATYGSDLYSLGTTCIYLLTGISPFDLFDISECTWVWRQYLVDNPVSEKLGNILDKLIEYATSRRYQSAGEVLRDINKNDSLVITNILSNASKHGWQCINTLYSHTKKIDSIAISPDGMILASGSHDYQVKLWEINTGKQLGTLEHEKSIYAVAFSSKYILASGDSQNNIHLWDINSAKKTRRLIGHKGFFAGVNCLSFSPDGGILASAGGDTTVKLWDVITGEEIQTLKGHNRWVSSVAISPNGNILVSASADKTAILWELNTGEILNTIDSINRKNKEVRSVAFSPDGKMIVTCSDDYNRAIKLWKVTSGELICTFPGHNNWIRYITFSPNGKILASSSYGNDIKLWDINTKQEICILTGHSERVNSLVFSPNGETLFSGSDDNTIKVWRCE